MYLMKELTSQQRSHLTKEAHHLKPVVMLGQKGASESLIKMVDESLEIHELIKIKFLDHKGDRRAITEKICDECKASLVRIVGNIAIIYRQATKPEDRQYRV